MVDEFLEDVKVSTSSGEQRRPKRNTAIPSRFDDFLVTESLPSENTKRPNIQIFIECLDLLNAEFSRRFSTENIALDFYLKEKLATKDLEAECKIYARVFKDKEWPKNENEKIDLSEVAIIVINNHQKGAPILSSLYKVAVTSGFTSTRVECVFSSLTRVDSPQRRSMKTQRETDLAYLSFESKVLLNDITFEDFHKAWKMKPRTLSV
ncbi:Hypothetical predicted protein, partial [Paramuricea clavata]